MSISKVPCSVQILTLNSGKTLEKCLESVKNFSEIIVLDGNSSDNTIEIAKQYGCRIFSQTDSIEPNLRIKDFGSVRNRGLKFASCDWCLVLDSDEYLSREAEKEIFEIIKKGEQNEYFIYNLPRKYVFEGRILEQIKISYQIRLFYIPAIQGFKKPVHERVIPKDGYKIGYLKNPEFVPLEDIAVLRKKWKQYLDIEQEKMKDITFLVFIRKTKANLNKFLKYFIKAIAGLALKRGQGIPFLYEFYNAVYHLQLIWRLFLNLAKNRANRQ